MAGFVVRSNDPSLWRIQMKNPIVVITLCLSIFALFSCDQDTKKTDAISDGLNFSFLPVNFELYQRAGPYGPYYSKPIYERNADDEIIREDVFCFTISKKKKPKKGWQVRFVHYWDVGYDHKVDGWLEDTDGDGKWDKSKWDNHPKDGKYDREWEDKNGDGLPQDNEIKIIDPPEQAPRMPHLP